MHAGHCLLILVALLFLSACDQATPSPAPATAAPASTPNAVPATLTPATQQPTPSIQGDGNILTDSLYHDSRDPIYRSPGGAVPAGTSVTLRLKTALDDLTAAQVRVWNTRTLTETLVPMTRVGPESWEASVATPSQAAALFYRFVVIDGTSVAYYTDSRDRDGGVGEGHLYQSDDDYTLVAYDPGFTTPAWLRDAVVYQIFPDRFDNGDSSNDKPAGTFIYGGQTESKQWGDTPESGSDFFGGDLKGVTQKLDYLQSLGVTAIYFNPIFTSPSNHRYDTTDYTQIDPSLGTLDDFRELVSRAREKGIRIILDGVFNHSSSDSLYFDKYSRYPTDGAYESQQSPYASWYTFKDFPTKYNSWSGINTLPVFTESDAVKQFLLDARDSIVHRWTKEGIGGWRLDAAEQKSNDFWRELRQALKQQDPDAVIIGEFWHNSANWLAGDQWDGTMNYRFRDAVLGWLANPVRPVETMVKQLDSIREDYPPQALAASMNLIDSHDTKRALTEAGGDKNMLRLLALMQFTWPGLPTVYYGDEAGLEGSTDPDDRRTYPWGSEDMSLISFYQMLGQVRHSTSALSTGDYINLGFDNQKDVYAFARQDANGVAVVGLNRSKQDQTFELSMAGVAPDGTTFTDHMNTGVTYTVQSGKIAVKLGARWGILLTSK
jgi:glycosidase